MRPALLGRGASQTQARLMQISTLPPPGVSAVPLSEKASPSCMTPHAALARPDFAPPPTLSQGQAVFWRYAAQIFGALLHFSLAGGFSAVRVVRVLDETGYLSGAERDRTYKRLLETTQAVMDYMVGLDRNRGAEAERHDASHGHRVEVGGARADAAFVCARTHVRGSGRQECV